MNDSSAVRPPRHPLLALPAAPPWALRRSRLRYWVTLAALAVGVGGCQSDHAPAYVTEEVRRATLRENISATGEVSARVKVNVGSQVSGTVAKLYVDFNSRVKKGDILAELDPRLFEAQLAKADATVAVGEADVEKAKVTLQDTNRTLARYVGLLSDKMLAQADYDTAQTARDAARAALKGSEAQLLQAQADRNQMATNLAFTKIRSPIDGVVIDRQVDAGQTVAAQFQVATLFVIANDMSHVRILADIDEADIGRVHEQMPVTFAVDAYPRIKFSGTIRALRQAPTSATGSSSSTSTTTTSSTSNVVTYAADIDAENPNNVLRQGMTAQVTVQTAEHVDVLTLPNAALRFRPKPGKPADDDKAGKSDAPAKGDAPGKSDAGAPGGNAGDEADAPKKLPEGVRQAHVYRLVQDKPRMATVKLGSTDGHRTEILDGLQEGDVVITGELGSTGGGRRGLF